MKRPVGAGARRLRCVPTFTGLSLRPSKKVFTPKSNYITLCALDTQSAEIAQSVEQWTENPRVDGSIPPLGNIV
jgi:hypothetical protein